jgi:DNA polymerase-3 subunit epsilon
MSPISDLFMKNARHGAAPNSLHARTPVNEAAYVVLDTELTGLDEKADSIISIGAIKMTGGRIHFGGTFSRLVNTDAAFKAESVVIHGITPQDLVEEPSIDEVLTEFLDFCGDAVLVGHLVFLDVQFINKEMKRLLSSTLQNPVADTFSLFHWLKKKTRANGFSSSMTGLYEIAACLGIPVQKAHNAVMDSFITAQVFQRLLPALIREGAGTLEEFLKIGNPFKGGEGFRMSRESTNL